MIKPNWDIFKAKFSENTQDNFEWFCYLLFCREFKKEKGIFRYKNQSAIETNPVEKEGRVIGWQSKFYTTNLSKNKTEISDLVKRAKKDYPNITDLIIYTNQEWGQCRGKPPKGFIEVEKEAEDHGIKLIWNIASFFESEFVVLENEIISKHFFSLDKSIFNHIEEQEKHTVSILKYIRTNIFFGNQKIEISRSDVLDKLKSSENKIIVLSGDGGVGKTVVIKKLLEESEKNLPFYVFKASRFNLTDINDLAANFNLQEFVDFHKSENKKMIVIDSAEKLLDLKNTDPFREFLGTLIENQWKVIFTTRRNYLDTLNTELVEIHEITPYNIDILEIDLEALNQLSKKYDFNLPSDEKLIRLLRNPFYLNEYLKLNLDDKKMMYKGFKEQLWKKRITNNKPEREQYFLKIAFKKASTGQFFIELSNDYSSYQKELQSDGILGYESPNGYYISHDIYEEWALEKKIELEFTASENNNLFFNEIGQSLVIRRCFRNWLSEKLLLENEGIKLFIEEALLDTEIEQFWKDEILISVLLSEYSGYFFEIFHENLLKDNQILLKKLTFLIRLSCKEIDESMFKSLGLKNGIKDLKSFLTTPRGKCWESFIEFIYDNIDEIGITNIESFLPVLHDWSNKYKKGITTRYVGLIVLKYYEIEYKIGSNRAEELLSILAYCASEIKEELEKILNDIIENKWRNSRDPHFDLSKFILTKVEGVPISVCLPNHILKLANLFWYGTSEQKCNVRLIGRGESCFNIMDDNFRYRPSSAFQTPIYFLLKSALMDTICFVLQFTNKTIGTYASKNDVEVINIFLEENKIVKQSINNDLYCMYRGRHNLPHILESIHMALEKFFIEFGKDFDSKILEQLLFFLLEHSKSASISAVVISVVLAFPYKTINVAKALFKTREFFEYDCFRFSQDSTSRTFMRPYTKTTSIEYERDIFDNERFKASQDEHRQLDLGQLCLRYQLFPPESFSEDEYNKIKTDIWKILDNFYSQLPKESEQKDSDKRWRISLVKMDSRKNNITRKDTDKGTFLEIIPKLDSDLSTYRDKIIHKIDEFNKYLALKYWAEFKVLNDIKYKQYEKYETEPELAFQEVKVIFSKLEECEKSTKSLELTQELKDFCLSYCHVPANVCSVFIKYYPEKITEEDKQFCFKVIVSEVYRTLHPSYRYQMGDGSLAAISVLPILLPLFQGNEKEIKILLLKSLLKNCSLGFGCSMYKSLSSIAIHQLWNDNFELAQSLLFGFLLLKPKYDLFQKQLYEEACQSGDYSPISDNYYDRFLSENETTVNNVLDSNISIDDIGTINSLDLRILSTAFELISHKISNPDYKGIIKEIISSFAQTIFSSDRNDEIDCDIKNNFLEGFSHFILNCSATDIEDWIQPFINNFNRSERVCDLFVQIIYAQDQIKNSKNFWKVWCLFKPKVIILCEKRESFRYRGDILKIFLFAQHPCPWQKATSWHTLTLSKKSFFSEMSECTGHCPDTLYAISKLLNGIGRLYLEVGAISWISSMLKANNNYQDKVLVVNTIYYLEDILRTFIYANREKIRKEIRIKNDVVIILDFLIEKGSVVGYLLREYIL